MSRLDGLAALGVVAEHVPLGPFTTYKMGGAARWFADVADEESLYRVLRAGVDDSVPVFVLGRGSNVVVSEHGFDGIVVRLGGRFVEWHVDEAGAVTAGAGVPLPLLARGTARLGRGGLEWFVGVPGSVGGAVCMNAGCFGSETADVLVSARIVHGISGEVADRTPQDLGMSYRHTTVGANDVVVSAIFATTPVDADVAQARIREITRWRRDNQPGGTLNAGSVFKNPHGDSAGRLIDATGLKGLAVGDVSVSQRHANFFVAGPAARPSDVWSLVALVQRRVMAITGVMLEPEVRFVGRFEEVA